MAIADSAVMYVGLHVSFRIHVFRIFGCIPRHRIAGPYGVLVLVFLRNFHTVFHGGCTSLHSHQQCKRVPFSQLPHQHLSSVFVLMIAILTPVR